MCCRVNPEPERSVPRLFGLGDVIAVLSSDEGSKTDIPAWVAKAGHELVETAPADGAMRFVVQKARSVYIFGQVKAPGAYPIDKDTTVLQALSLAGGVTDRGSTGRIKIVRTVDGKKKEIKVKLTDLVEPGDTLIIAERFF